MLERENPVGIVTNGMRRCSAGAWPGELRPYIRGWSSARMSARRTADAGKGMELAQAIDKRRALMLGDSLTSDIAAAGTRGDACWFNPKGAANDKGLLIDTKSSLTRWMRFLTNGGRAKHQKWRWRRCWRACWVA
ncbi:MAG: hypothetical protein ACLUI3_16890 [Christensenellales bacterium]